MKLPLIRSDIQMRFTDLDALGHVSNSVYMQYLDMGRVDFFRAARREGEKSLNVMVNTNIEMLKEIRMKDKVHVKTWCSKVGTKSMEVMQCIYANDVCTTKVKTVLVGFDIKTRKSTPLPTDWEPTDEQERPQD